MTVLLKQKGENNMALVTINFESKYIGFNHEVSIILPNKPWEMTPKAFYENGKKYKVLWLLHGMFGDHSDWVRKSNIEVYAAEKDLIVVMPSGFNAGYGVWPDYANGLNMEDYLTEELMPMIHNWFPASDKPEDNFIAGLSMGGAGTLRYLLWNPDKFAAGCCMSAPPRDYRNVKTIEDLNKIFPMGAERTKKRVEMAGGLEAYLDGKNNLHKRILEMHEAGTLPKLMITCGQLDSGYEAYVAFRDLCKAKKIPIKFSDLPDLAHEWRYWDLAVQEALEFFEL